MTRPAALFVRIPPLPAAIEPAWNRWYDEEHIAYRLPLRGFVGARRFSVDRGPIRHVALYELADVSALTEPEYLAHRRWEEALPSDRFESIAPSLAGFARGVYQQSWPRNASYSPPPGEALLIVDLDTAALSPEALARWFEDEHAPALRSIEGVHALRLLHLEQSLLGPASGRRNDKPATIAIYELATGSVASRDDFRAAMAGANTSARVVPADDATWTLASLVYSSFRAAG